MKWCENQSYIYRNKEDINIEDLLFSINVGIENSNLYCEKCQVHELTKVEKDQIELPEEYQFDLVIDKLSGGDYALIPYDLYRDGNGDILGRAINGILIEMNGTNVNHHRQYLAPTWLLNSIDEIQRSINILNGDECIGYEKFNVISTLQKIANQTPLILHSSLRSPVYEIFNTADLDVVSIEGEELKAELVPYVTSDYIGKVNFDLSKTIRSRVHHNESCKVRIVPTESLKNDLKKLKNNNVVSLENDSVQKEYLVNPNKFLNITHIDFSNLSERVIEIGNFNPRFYSFLIPDSRGKWIPNIQIGNPVSGKKVDIRIGTKTMFEEFRIRLKLAEESGKESFSWEGNSISNSVAKKLIPKFEKAFILSDTNKVKAAKCNNESGVLVFKIHENAEELDYIAAKNTDVPVSMEAIEFKFHEIDVLKSPFTLREHQLRGVSGIQYLMNNQLDYTGALLADDMGLGKTIQVLYLIEYYSTKNTNKPCIIVAPVSLLANWQNEYSKFFKHPSYRINLVRAADIPKHQHIDTDVISDLQSKQLILTNYETFRDAQLTFGQIDFGVMAIDEAQRIKTPGTMITSAIKAAKAEFKIAMTGTPVENTMVDLWSIMDFVQPGLFGSAKMFHATYQRPMESQSEDHGQLILELRDRMGLQFIRRLKSHVVEELPNKILERIECPLTPIQVEVYNRYVQEYQASATNNPLPFIHKFKLICDCPLLLDYNLVDLSITELVDSTSRLQKLKVVLDRIQEKFEKVIVFTEYRATQSMLKKLIEHWYGISPSIINGRTATEDTQMQLSRQSLIDEYQETEGFNVIIMSPVAAGVGLNVTAANHVIHYSRHWNPAKESQATDRAFRIGQKKNVYVYHLISTYNGFETFDVILEQLLIKKSNLSDASMYPSSVIEVSDSEMVSAIDIEGLTGSNYKKEYSYQDIIRFKPLQFETAIAAIYQSNEKYDVRLTPRSNDYGADVVCFGEVDNLLIQVKQSRNPINNEGVKDVLAAMKIYKLKYNIEFNPVLVSNSTLTKNALKMLTDTSVKYYSVKELMDSLNVESISYNALLDLESRRIYSI